MDTRRKSSTPPGGASANATTDRDHQSSASMEVKFHSSYDEADMPIPLSFWLKCTSLFFFLTLMSSSVYRPCLSNTGRNVTPAPHQFIGANARQHLQKVTSLGSRTSGSLANEVLAPEYLLSELYDIARLGKSNGVDIFVDEQLSSTASFRTGYAVQSYKNVKNLLLRFHNSSLSNHTTAFLVNCHYDSFLGSPGATDTFVNCAILLEAGRAIATGKVQLVNDLIFLFNGAEESGLLTSHAFVTQHRWANDVKSFLNLEGTGAGGRLFVFQSSPDESSQLLLGTYESCFHYPYADVFGEEIFQSGLIPSDTDFRIFRDFGFVPGLDMAYVRDGYAYHTPFDTEARISEECLQQNGEEILRFLSAIGGDKRLESVSKLKPVNDTGLPSSGPPLNELSSTQISRSQLPKPQVQTSAQHRHVYFDILGIKLFVVSWARWKLFNWFISLLVCCRLCFIRGSLPSRWVGLGISLVLHCLSQVLGLIFSLLLGFVVHNFGFRMSWYSNQYNVVGLYILPLLCWFICYSTWFFHTLHRHCGFLRKICAYAQWSVTRDRRWNYALIETDFFDAATLLLTVLVSVLTILDRPAVFLFTLWLTSTMLGRFTHKFVFPGSALSSLSNFLLTLMPTLTLWHVYFSRTILEVFIPIFGRSGNLVRQDVLMSGFVFFCVAPVALFILGPLHCSSTDCGKTLRLLFLNACVTYAVLVHSSSYGFPYTFTTRANINDPSISPRFQRLSVFHIDRTFHGAVESKELENQESFITIVAWDSNGVQYLKPQTGLKFLDDNENGKPNGLVELLEATPSYCNFSLPYCGIPFFRPLFNFFTDFYHIPAKQHGSKPVAQIDLISRIPMASSQLQSGRVAWNYTFSLWSGPPQTPLALRFEVPHVRLLNWSFAVGTSVPVPVPLTKSPSDPHVESVGGHYFLDFIDARASVSLPVEPWVFWLVIDRPSDMESSHFDIAVMGTYLDTKLPSCVSAQLDDVVSRLPPWVSLSSGCASYDHYRVGLS
ncbi:hypothetical protein CRM22_008123 [Opisthorchis felineus]|uniref:Uncharacterized protein n=1 Tax=Opisthorchis felineus TaxID=147828 RepID=A0A4S2LCP8_OPIFE|nr:hypothetical protein CRM22_008123 [Opisthorchis felineus]